MSDQADPKPSEFALIEVVTRMLHEDLEGAYVLAWADEHGQLSLQANLKPTQVDAALRQITDLLATYKKRVSYKPPPEKKP